MTNVINRMGSVHNLPRFPDGPFRGPRNEVKAMKYLLLVFLGHCGSLWTVVDGCGVVVGSLWLVVARSGF